MENQLALNVWVPDTILSVLIQLGVAGPCGTRKLNASVIYLNAILVAMLHCGNPVKSVTMQLNSVNKTYGRRTSTVRLSKGSVQPAG